MNWTGNVTTGKNDEDSISFTLLQNYLKVRDASVLAVPITIGVLLLVGFIGNFIVMYVTITTKRVAKHPLHSLLVLNLAMADLVYLFSSAPYQAMTFSARGWIYGSFMCPTLHFLNIQTMSVSIFTMCSLALMRFFAIKLPFKFDKSFAKYHQRYTASLIIAISWLLGSILSSPNLIFYRVIDHAKAPPSGGSNTGTECAWGEDSSRNTFRICHAVITFVLPALMVVVFYCLIARDLCFIKNNLPQTDNEKRDYIKSTVLCFFLVLAFLVCWFPYHLTAVFKIANQWKTGGQSFEDAATRLIMQVFALCFSYAHACVNPIIYTFASPGFRLCLCDSWNTRHFERFNNSCETQLRVNRPSIASSRCDPKRGNSIEMTVTRPLDSPEPMSDNSQHENEVRNLSITSQKYGVESKEMECLLANPISGAATSA